MSAWHLFPTFLRGRDGDHVRVLLVFDITGRRMVGVGPASDGPAAEATLHLLAATEGGWPDEVRHLPNPVFDDLDEAIDDALLAAAGLHLEPVTADQLDEDLARVLDQGRGANAGLRGHSETEALEAAHEALDWDEHPPRRRAGPALP